MTDSTTVDNQKPAARPRGGGWQAKAPWLVTVCAGVALAMLAMSLGLLAMYTLGLTWLGHVVGWDKPILALGLKPFILGDLLKITLVAWALPLLHRLRRR